MMSFSVAFCRGCIHHLAHPLSVLPVKESLFRPYLSINRTILPYPRGYSMGSGIQYSDLPFPHCCRLESLQHTFVLIPKGHSQSPPRLFSAMHQANFFGRFRHGLHPIKQQPLFGMGWIGGGLARYRHSGEYYVHSLNCQG